MIKNKFLIKRENNPAVRRLAQVFTGDTPI